MLDNLQLWLFGTAALIDTVLLFALLERHNWRAVTIWMLLLALGVWSWHVGYFGLLLLTDAVGPLANPVRWLAMLAMAFGLMAMPSAALHGTFRLLRHGKFQLGTYPDRRLMWCYTPLILLINVGQLLAADPSAVFVELLSSYLVPYAIWLLLVSVFTSYGLCRTARSTTNRPAQRFYYSLATSMIVISLLTTVYIAWVDDPSGIVTALRVIVCLLPIVPAALFAYFVMRFQLLPLILERTLVYGALVGGAILFHQIVFRKMISSVQDHFQLDFGVIEAIAVFILILLYQPLRRRFAEALQSFVDSSDSRRSDRQRLAIQLATRAGDPLPDLLKWFTEAMQRSFGTDVCAAWLCGRDGTLIDREGRSELLGDLEVRSLLVAMSRGNSSFLTRYSASDPLIISFLDRVRAGALLRFEHAEISGLFLIGCRRWGQPPSEEDLHALSLLVEQFGVTLHRSQLLAMQVAAEHRFLQQEKLSTVGLIASSLAHEIKNPLSSIKTIIKVLAEDIGPDSPYAEDLRMISGEVERLTMSTSDLLAAARPPRADLSPAPIDEILSPTLRLLNFLAKQCDVELAVKFAEKSIYLNVDQIGLREIVFNLISNAIDAAGKKGQVAFTCQEEPGRLTLAIRDNGPGIPAEQMTRIFEPFFTTKSTGTGLGLYIVARRVRELGGQIDCQSDPRQGTTFLIRLPHANH